jgi:hypothetical protein
MSHGASGVCRAGGDSYARDLACALFARGLRTIRRGRRRLDRRRRRRRGRRRRPELPGLRLPAGHRHVQRRHRPRVHARRFGLPRRVLRSAAGHELRRVRHMRGRVLADGARHHVLRLRLLPDDHRQPGLRRVPLRRRRREHERPGRKRPRRGRRARGAGDVRRPGRSRRRPHAAVGRRAQALHGRPRRSVHLHVDRAPEQRARRRRRVPPAHRRAGDRLPVQPARVHARSALQLVHQRRRGAAITSSRPGTTPATCTRA